MPSSNIVPAPLLSLTPELVASLKQHAEDVLTYLVNTNSGTIFFREAPMLSDFCKALGENNATDSRNVDPIAPGSVYIDTFSKTVPLSTYDDYRPFVSRFLETPRCTSNISNMFAPGLPAFVVTSSGTAGGVAKYFLKYKHPLSVSLSGVTAMKDLNSTSMNGGSHCVIFNLKYSELLDILESDTSNSPVVKKVPLCLASAVAYRSFMQWSVEDDATLMKTKAPNCTSPLAICFIHPYRTFLLMHALFALEDRTVKMINALFSTIFFDFIRLVEEYWDPLVQAIENGVVPEFEGVDHVKHHLQAHLKPNPVRAAELRAVGKDTSSPGWAKRLWPNLERVLGNASGMFERVIHQVRHYLGPSVSFQSISLTSSEAWIAYIYDPWHELNLYKVASDDLFEYLDITLPEAPGSLKRNWELETGKTYELVLTTRDGMWRYRLGDVLEVAGFDPTDGQPIIRYSERRNVIMRASGEFTTEKELRDAIHSLKNTLGTATEFTVIIDDRKMPRAYGFLVELEGNPGQAASTSPALIHDFLSTKNETYVQFTTRGVIGMPTLRLLAPDTFRLYREWKVKKSAVGSGQTKVPTVVYDLEVRDWLLDRVIGEV